MRSTTLSPQREDEYIHTSILKAPLSPTKSKFHQPIPLFRTLSEIVHHKRAQKEAKPEKKVSFGTIQVRKYKRVVGYVPEIPLSLGLGWEFKEYKPLSLDIYCEHKKKRTNFYYESPFYQNPTTMFDRLAVLTKYGYSKEELVRAEKVRNQRSPIRLVRGMRSFAFHKDCHFGEF